MDCANAKCPFKEECDDKQLLQFQYENIDMLRCPKCDTIFYCSNRCAQQDWFKRHQFECRGVQHKLVESEVERIEKSTPFIKQGILYDKNKDESEFKNITLDEIEFERKGNYILGKGSYGEVELGIHKKT